MKTSSRISAIVAQAWANPLIRKLVVTGIVALIGFTGLEVTGTTVEAVGAAAMLVISE